MTMIFKIGDIIHQTKDNIVFLVSNVSKNLMTLEYFDTHSKTQKSFDISKKSIMAQFEERAEFLVHYKVVRKVKN